MESSRQSLLSSGEQITSSTIKGTDDISQPLSVTISTAAAHHHTPTESPSDAVCSTASPGACASTVSTAVVGVNNPLPLMSFASVRHSEAAGSDTGKVKVGAADQPDAPLPNHYDAVIVHDVRDLERAELFRGRLLNVLEPAGEGLRLSFFGCQADVSRSYYEQLEDTVRRSTYLMFFVTRNLCDDRVVGALLRNQLLSEMLDNREKRWCLIPIWTEPEDEYARPMALRALVGIAEKSMSDKLRRESVVRMFTDKRSWRVLREQTERERRAKEDEQKLQKLKDDEAERQHKERLQQLDEDHQRELRNAQSEAELNRLLEKNAHARREEENSAAVGNRLMQMQFHQQKARHLRDQRILEEWQHDAEEQAHAMAGCPITGGAPSVLPGAALPAAGFLPVDLQHQPQLPPGVVALRVEDLAAINAVLLRLQQTSGNVCWPPTDVPLQQQVPPPGGQPFSHAGTGRLLQSLSVPADIGGVAGNASAVDPIFRLRQQMSYSGSSSVLARNTSLDLHFASRSPSHVDLAAVPLRPWKEVDKTFTDPAPSSPENEVHDTSSVPTFSISKLVPVLTREMDRYIHRFPTFSYQFGWKGELTAYVLDLSNDAIDDLKKELEKQLCQHIPEEHVKVTVVSRLPTMTLCCGGIGTTLNVGEDSQLVGLYLQYDGDGTIFWVSSAHGLLRASDRVHLRVAPDAVTPPQVEINRRIRSRFSACLDLRAVELLAPYIVFQYDGVVISHNEYILRRFCSEHLRNCAVQKPTLCHSVDIMIGPTPLTSWHLRGPLATYALQLTSAVDGCGQPPLCSIACHASTTQFYRITGIRQFDIVSFENVASFDMEDLKNDTQLLSYLGGKDRLAKGTVCSIPCNRYRTIVAGHEYVLQNVIVIQPTADSCRPRQGHSGSVWVQQRGNKSEAVAITCAVITCPENPTVEKWLAAPLCACLLALSEEYPQVFEDYSKFTVLI